jgi:hypothetical protein
MLIRCSDIDGNAQLTVFSGPPNYESIKRGDGKERAVILIP